MVTFVPMDQTLSPGSILFKPGSDLMFTRTLGWAMYSFISLSRSMPPARNRPSLPHKSRALAGEVAVTYWKDFIGRSRGGWSKVLELAKRVEHSRGGDRETIDPDAKGIGHCIGDCRRGGNGDWLAYANDAALG